MEQRNHRELPETGEKTLKQPQKLGTNAVFFADAKLPTLLPKSRLKFIAFVTSTTTAPPPPSSSTLTPLIEYYLLLLLLLYQILSLLLLFLPIAFVAAAVVVVVLLTAHKWPGRLLIPELRRILQLLNPKNGSCVLQWYDFFTWWTPTVFFPENDNMCLSYVNPNSSINIVVFSFFSPLPTIVTKLLILLRSYRERHVFHNYIGLYSWVLLLSIFMLMNKFEDLLQKKILHFNLILHFFCTNNVRQITESGNILHRRYGYLQIYFYLFFFSNDITFFFSIGLYF